MKRIAKNTLLPDRTLLRDRLIETAGRILKREGYDALSMRRVAQEVGCSQMAVYRYFTNKDALTQHLCAELYREFTHSINQEMDRIEDPWEQLRMFIVALIHFALQYPDHYSLIFLVRNSDPEVVAERERLGQEFVSRLREVVRGVLPSQMENSMVDMRLRQVLSCLHGTAALLIAHPEAYGLSRQKAISDVESIVLQLLYRN